MKSREFLLEEEKRLVRELDTVRRMLQEANKEFGYQGVRPLVAMRKFLNENGPATREQIRVALVAGGQQYGKDESQAISNINNAIQRSLGTRALREFRGLIGLSEWPDSKWPEIP